MAKPEWGTKRTCPKCGTRFYDLQKDDPATCIDCGTTWTPEPILKAKQPVIIDKAAAAKAAPKEDDETDNEDLLDDDDDIDLGGDDDDIVSLDDDDDDEVTGMVDSSLSDDE
ncbi:TIGR02300 family protein [Gimibacter soli]|uniref:TIGR02300 family protein n=1 Tax=Gimibacter soli TaxID=3024400 RepID=A0AAE9XPD2_9PROT|nr:TIGR02300 family protein [Gimibacter soli]WCL54743.1 TIGR02300 family protein [Gimibacter soli]